MWFIAQLVLRIIIYIAFLLLALTACVIITQAIRISQQTIPGLPWVGLEDRKLFPKLRACLGELSVGRDAIEEGWKKYGKHGIPFMLPGLEWSTVVLPPHLTGWMIRQPDALLSTPMGDMLGAKFLAHGPDMSSVLDFTVLRRDLIRHTAKLVKDIQEEADAALDVLGGTTGEAWKEVKVTPMVEEVVFRITNRIFVGLPLCRSKRFKNAIRLWSVAFGIGVLVNRFLVPGLARPYIMPFIAAPENFFRWWAVSYLTPNIKGRLTEMENSGLLAPPSQQEQLDDMTQWIINHNSHKSNSAELEPSNIAGKMILLNLIASGTISMIGTVALIDILSYKEAPALLAELREEVQRVLPMLDEDPTAIRSMTKLDSVIRETLRLHPLNAIDSNREVVATTGLVTPDGLQLPQGTHVATLTSSMQSDPDFWGDDAAEYDPLRFYKQGVVEKTGAKQIAAVQISAEYMSFGLGKHACPGRFFAVAAIKLTLANLLVRYDVEPFEERPKFTALAGIMMPNDQTKVKLRKREGKLS